jgi:phosphoribosylformylglycinamidine synthase
MDVDNVRDVRVGRRVELTVEAEDETAAASVVERLAGELFANPLIEAWSVESAR